MSERIGERDLELATALSKWVPKDRMERGRWHTMTCHVLVRGAGEVWVDQLSLVPDAQ